MELRVRSSQTLAFQGVFHSAGGFVYDTGDVEVLRRNSRDYYKKKRRSDGTLPPSEVDLDRIDRGYIRIHRQTGTNRWNNYAIGASGTPDLLAYTARGSNSRNQENNLLVAELLAGTNPFRYEYSVPVAIKELVEVSQMFSLAAKTFTAFFGGAYLNYRFGWSAFAKDIEALCGLTTAIERRVREFNSLAEHGSLRRNMKLGKLTDEESIYNKLIYSSGGVSVRVTNRIRRSRKVWGSVTWKVNSGVVLPVKPLEQFNLAVRSALDLDALDAATVWELIPWSWLVDYFTNIGNSLKARGHRLEVTPHDICIMREFETHEDYEPTSWSQSLTLGGNGFHYRTLKTRDVWPPGTYPRPALPLISLEQWKVIVALMAKFRR